MSSNPESIESVSPSPDAVVGAAVGHLVVAELAHEPVTWPDQELSAFDRAAVAREVNDKTFYVVPGKVSPIRMRLR